MQKTLPPDELKRHTVILEPDMDIPVPELTEKLIAAGYSRTDKVEGAGQFSVRGSITDIFPVSEMFPLEFWGDTIDTVSAFDIESQRRTDTLKRIAVPPAMEVLFDSPSALINKIEEI